MSIKCLMFVCNASLTSFLILTDPKSDFIKENEYIILLE